MAVVTATAVAMVVDSLAIIAHDQGATTSDEALVETIAADWATDPAAAHGPAKYREATALSRGETCAGLMPDVKHALA